MELQGTYVGVGDIEQITDTFKKRNLWVDNTDAWAASRGRQSIVQLEVLGGKTEEIDFDQFSKGDHVVCKIDIKGRVWTDPKTGERKIFNSISCWAIQAVDGVAPQDVPPSTRQTYGDPQPGDIKDTKEDASDPDDLPF